jgi:transposase
MQRRQLNGDGGMEALRILKRRLSDVVYRAMLTDHKQSLATAA